MLIWYGPPGTSASSIPIVDPITTKMKGPMSRNFISRGGIDNSSARVIVAPCCCFLYKDLIC